MNETSYFAGIIRILEIPKQKIVNNRVVTIFRAQLTQTRIIQIITVIFQRDLARDVKNYYKVNDYIIIEGYLTFQNKQLLDSKILKKGKVIKLKVLAIKAYPILLSG